MRSWAWSFLREIGQNLNKVSDRQIVLKNNLSPLIVLNPSMFGRSIFHNVGFMTWKTWKLKSSSKNPALSYTVAYPTQTSNFPMEKTMPNALEYGIGRIYELTGAQVAVDLCSVIGNSEYRGGNILKFVSYDIYWLSVCSRLGKISIILDQ